MNNRQSILVVCNTPFQIIVACHVLHTFYGNADVDLYISSGIRGYAQLVQNARKTSIFREVQTIPISKTFCKGSGAAAKCSYVIKRAFEIIRTLLFARSISKRQYDVLLFSNISVFTKRLTTLFCRANPNGKIGLFEEGTITYTKQFIAGDSPKTLYRRFFDKNGVIDRLSALYVFNPIFLSWNPKNGEIITIPKLTEVSKEYKGVLNTIFGYEQCEDTYDKKVIFFEESHVMEGFKVPDIQIVEKIAQKVGQDNVMVKIHPRNPENRFAKLGYKTNVNTSIPWELIILNQPMDDKILVTISSGSVIYPYLYFGITTKTYSLLNCLEERPGLMKGENGELMQRIYTTYPNILMAPKTIDEFLSKIA